MCVVSMVGDHYRDKWIPSWSYPDQPFKPFDHEKRRGDREDIVKILTGQPISREEFVESMLNVSPEIAKMQKIDMEWRRNNQAQMWLEFLEDVKREKDKNSAQWRRMCNMD